MRNKLKSAWRSLKPSQKYIRLSNWLIENNLLDFYCAWLRMNIWRLPRKEMKRIEAFIRRFDFDLTEVKNSLV